MFPKRCSIKAKPPMTTSVPTEAIPASNGKHIHRLAMR
jgi:hypothetical protein